MPPPTYAYDHDYLPVCINDGEREGSIRGPHASPPYPPRSTPPIPESHFVAESSHVERLRRAREIKAEKEQRANAALKRRKGGLTKPVSPKLGRRKEVKKKDEAKKEPAEEKDAPDTLQPSPVKMDLLKAFAEAVPHRGLFSGHDHGLSGPLATMIYDRIASEAPAFDDAPSSDPLDEPRRYSVEVERTPEFRRISPKTQPEPDSDSDSLDSTSDEEEDIQMPSHSAIYPDDSLPSCNNYMFPEPASTTFGGLLPEFELPEVNPEEIDPEWARRSREKRIWEEMMRGA